MTTLKLRTLQGDMIQYVFNIISAYIKIQNIARRHDSDVQYSIGKLLFQRLNSMCLMFLTLEVIYINGI